ncbi:hypothetical protein LTR85_005972 [Meristemomyces frigidus]|nr:hypothetical protein LTR85_005972 [Meristemomyces frigidus]
MSDSDSLSAHPTVGGKSLESLQPHRGRAAYKSWRKKYRKMRHTFDGVLEENKRLFKEEHKLESIAKRLREELDGLLDICLDLNENPSIPPDLRFNIRPAPRHAPPIYVEPHITPEEANAMVAEYRDAVSLGRIPPLDLHVVRDQIEQRLAAQDVETLDKLSATIPHPTTSIGQPLPEDIRGDDPSSYLTPDQETAYLHRLDTKLGVDPFTGPRPSNAETAKILEEEKHFATLTPREQERQIELLNPQSQHSWLATHSKSQPPGGIGGMADVDDNESLASHDQPKPAPRKRGGGGGGGNKNLAKQVGDRAVERAREGFSPSAASAGFAGDMEQDELSMMDDQTAPSSGRKKGRDPDGAYRVKGGKGGAGGPAKGKRKRTSGEDIGASGGGSSKKARVSGEE